MMNFLGGLRSAPFGYLLHFLPAVNLQHCHGGMPSSAVLPVRLLMSSGSPSCSDTDRPTPQPRTPAAAAAAAVHQHWWMTLLLLAFVTETIIQSQGNLK